MKHIWLLGATGVFSGLLFYVYTARVHADEVDPLTNLLESAPAPEAIRGEVQAKTAQGQLALSLAKQQDLFGELFTRRFRSHEPKMAVRLRFVDGSHIKLMCPARMEPWNMDRIAMSAWRETRTVLGHPYDIDLYETFIGAKPKKVGELRVPDAKTPIANIHYAAYSQWVTVDPASKAPVAPVIKPASFVSSHIPHG